MRADSNKGGRTKPDGEKPSTRMVRLKTALKANLARRKAQAEARRPDGSA